MRVALFVPCLVSEMAPRVAEATARVLARVGLEVVAPRRQTCCDLLSALAVATEGQRAPVFVDDEQGVGRPAGLALDE